MVVKNPYMVLETRIWTSKTHIRGVSGGTPPLAPPARVMLVRGRAEYRRSLSGAREMCVPTGPAGEMCVPKPFSCFVFCLVALREKPKTGSAGKQESALRDESPSSVRVTSQSLSHSDKEEGHGPRAADHATPRWSAFGRSKTQRWETTSSRRHIASRAHTNETNTISWLVSPPNLRS